MEHFIFAVSVPVVVIFLMYLIGRLVTLRWKK